MTQPVGEKRDLVLAPGEYAYLQDETRGQIKTNVGPTVINQSPQDRPVVFDPETKAFVRTHLEGSVRKCPVASEGEYLVLENPSNDGKNPSEGISASVPALKNGRKVNIPGPCSFGLWPMQIATVVPGHHLRSNQYLLVRIYNEEEAKNNWNKSVAVSTNSVPVTPTEGEATPPTVTATTSPDALNLTIGKLLIIKGTDISFYIPPTGVEVVKDENVNYIREAVTLEQLEYCILINENGKRRYERGPQVVFPSPTEQFYMKDGRRKFHAIELNGIQGIHVKIVSPYFEGDRELQVGEELFITGDQNAIYFPRVEHSIIQYGDKQKHYATAVPNAGEGRYVMDRNTGEIVTEKGPKMLLPDPRRYVIVRRVLSDKQCELWYPGNAEALAYNRSLREIAKESPSNRSGFVSEGDVEKTSGPRKRGLSGGSDMRSAFPAAYGNVGASSMSSSSAEPMPDVLLADQLTANAASETFERGTHYTPPRTITLDTKFEGVPSLTIWTGYAVMVVSKTGSRRVVVGPQTILLNYDESLEVLELSTGKPKTTDKLEKTVYLRTTNNKVSDIVEITTSDKVNVELKLSYRVNFEGEDPNLWFEVENYVKYLCDHARSMLKGMGQKKKIEDIDSNGVDLVRTLLLGIATESERPGMFFKENGMRMTEVEVLGINIKDGEIAKLLNSFQHQVVKQNIDLHQAEKDLEVTSRKERIQQEKDQAAWQTAKVKARIDMEKLAETTALNQARLTAEKDIATKQKEVEEAKETVIDLGTQRRLGREKSTADQVQAIEAAKADLRIAGEKSETENVCARFAAAKDGLSPALAMLHDQDTLVKVAEAMSIQHMIGGKSLTDVIAKMFEGSGLHTHIDTLMKSVAERMGNGTANPTAATPARR